VIKGEAGQSFQLESSPEYINFRIFYTYFTTITLFFICRVELRSDRMTQGEPRYSRHFYRRRPN